MTRILVLAAALGSAACGSCAYALDLPFAENFAMGDAQWGSAGGPGGLIHQPTGGPDGDGFVTSVQDFALINDGDDITLFRGHDFFNSSNDAFVGNWIADGVGRFSFFVRHNLPVPANFFTRFASSINFPGGIAIEFAPVLPQTWTEISFEISADNPQFVSFEGTDFETVFSSIGNVQVGVRVPAGLGMDATPWDFALDAPAISVPEPSSGGLLLALALLLKLSVSSPRFQRKQ